MGKECGRWKKKSLRMVEGRREESGNVLFDKREVGWRLCGGIRSMIILNDD